VFRYGVLPVSGTPQPREYAASSSRIVPDEGRTFGFEVLYSEFGITPRAASATPRSTPNTCPTTAGRTRLRSVAPHAW
jgi:hypothetical protein